MKAQSTYEIVTSYLLENQNKFYRLAFSYTKNPETAMDAVQNAACKALEHYNDIRNIAFLKTWFYKILVNESLSLLKRNQREIPHDTNDFSNEFAQELAYEETYGSDDPIYSHINRLPLPNQTVIKLHFFEEMTLKEIASITGTNLSTVKSRLYASLKKLKTWIEEESA